MTTVVKVCSPASMRKYLGLGRVIFIPANKPRGILVGRKAEVRHFSAKTALCDVEFNCKEIGIPVPGGTLAGKLWESKCSSEGKQSSSSENEPPPVLCLHGWLDNAGTFDLMLPLMMTPSTRYFCLDFPGHGLTTYCPDWWYDSHMEGILAVRRVAKHFGWEKFSILGHSLGGIVGFLYAAYFPGDVHRLVALENMRPLPLHISRIDMTRAAINLVFEVEERMREPKKVYSYEDILKRLYEGRQGTVSKDGCNALLKRGASKLGKDHYQFSYNLRTNIPGQEGRTPAEISGKLAEEISSPVCFIKADPGNIYDKKEETEKFLQIFKNKLGKDFEHHKVPGTHHFHLNDPQLVAPIALNFLTKS